MPKPLRANFILQVEKEELFINAGLQDRVVQVCIIDMMRAFDNLTMFLSSFLLNILVFFKASFILYKPGNDI